MIIFNNYEELKKENELAANELISKFGTGEWQNQEIYMHNSVEDFAEYELIEGWYVDLNLDKDFNGAPNPLDFIDYKEFGDALVRNWDDTCNYKADNGKVLNTSYGW